MKNFEFEHNGENLWYSRSLACCNIIIRYDSAKRTIEVLAVKRGPGCEFNKGKWNVPAGFIDFDEDAKQCARRETQEETGMVIPEDRLRFEFLDTAPKGVRQTMVAVFSTIYPKNTATARTFEECLGDLSHAEPGEVEEVKWINVKELGEYDWTRDQVHNIRAVLRHNSWVGDVVGDAD